MLNLISKVIATLNTINVHGKEDLDSMLGCIQALEKLVYDIENPSKAEEVKDG